jgi:hypothetical protein
MTPLLDAHLTLNHRNSLVLGKARQGNELKKSVIFDIMNNPIIHIEIDVYPYLTHCFRANFKFLMPAVIADYLSPVNDEQTRSLGMWSRVVLKINLLPLDQKTILARSPLKRKIQK